MRILITGAAGFIGSHLADRFLEDGHTVVGMDNLLTGRMENLSLALKSRRFKFIKHNVSTYIDLPGKLDAVLHFASPASPIDYARWPIPTLKVGALGTHNTLGLAKKHACRYLLASTSEVYGDPLVSPQKETYWGNVNPIGPRGVYDEAKRYAEAMAMAYHNSHGIPVRIVRIFNTYGPRMRPNDGRAIPNFITQALSGQPLTVYGTGKQTRSFCYIDDEVEGLVRLLMSDYAGPVNVGNPVEYTLKQLAERILALTGSESKIVYQPLPVDDPKVRRPDISLAKKLLRWTPKVGLDQGLKKTIAYFRALN